MVSVMDLKLGGKPDVIDRDVDGKDKASDAPSDPILSRDQATTNRESNNTHPLMIVREQDAQSVDDNLEEELYLKGPDTTRVNRPSLV